MKYRKSFNVKKYFKPIGATVNELCPWEIILEDGICISKNADLIKAFRYTPPDLGSSSAYKIASVAANFNRSVMQLGSGWGIQFEVQRILNNEYPISNYDNAAGFVIENQREMRFLFEEAHFENRYYIILTYGLPSDIEAKTSSFFMKKTNIKKNVDIGLIEAEIKNFTMQCEKLIASLSHVITFHDLNKDEMLTLLHNTMNIQTQELKMPTDCNLFVDQLIANETIETSMPLKIGTHYVPVLAIHSFPSATLPAMFDALNASKIPYRWSSRFVCYDKELAQKTVEKYQKKFHGARKSIGQLVTEMTMNVESTRFDTGAIAKEGEANEALSALALNELSFGEYSANIIVWDEDKDVAIDKIKYIANLVSSCQFAVKEETFNGLYAFLSMQPGNLYANIRNMIISTQNLSHVIPLSSVWSGHRSNAFMKKICGIDSPHVVCATNYGIPFFLNLNVGDVGHTWISGPTGAGKSTLLALLEIQWLKYPNSRVIIFDKDKSARTLTIATGGIYIEPGKDEIAFQPLADLDSAEERRWAVEFIECLLTEQKIEVSAKMRGAINDAIQLLSTKEVKARTLSSFAQYCNGYANTVTGDNDILEGINPYLLDGQYGNLFDADENNLSLTRWTMFEMGTLMNMAGGAVAPALMFLFHEIEKYFTGEPVLLILDEAWLFLKNPIFSAKIVDWLKTLRKKHVFCVFATQEIDDAANSPIASTLVSQCMSKIFLADPDISPIAREAYKKFGLEDAEIKLISESQMKKDYYYKSPSGTRLFQLDLDALQLALLTTDHAVCDAIEEIHGRNSREELTLEILDKKQIDYTHVYQGR